MKAQHHDTDLDERLNQFDQKANELLNRDEPIDAETMYQLRREFFALTFALEDMIRRGMTDAYQH